MRSTHHLDLSFNPFFSAVAALLLLNNSIVGHDSGAAE